MKKKGCFRNVLIALGIIIVLAVAGFIFLGKNDIEEYQTDLAAEMTECSTKLDALSQRWDEKDEDLLFDSDYISDMHVRIDDFENYCTNFYDENAPAELAKMNDMLNEADINYSQAADYMRSGIDDLDAGKLEISADFMDAGHEKLYEASDWFENHFD